MPTPLTIDASRRAIAIRLAAAGIESPLLDARLLVGAALGLDLTGLAAQAQRPLMGEEAAAIEGMVLRRLAGEPIARILGVREFWGMSLQLSSETLVPRPDTETIVEAALALNHREAALRIADLGTGTGAILLALLHERPNAWGVGTDISAQAVATARGNAARFGVALRSTFLVCDFAAALAGPFDLIVSNPPYIPSADIASLAVEVRDHDPRRALDGGPDGLDAYRTIARQAASLLAPAGHLIVEIGSGQTDDVTAIVRNAGLSVRGLPDADLAGISRALTAQRLPP
jgi:release factor glutamine methyltransferase